MASAFLKAPELAIEQSDARALAEAIAEVNRHYRIPVLRDDHAAIGALLGVCVAVYAPRVMAIANRRKRRGKGQEAQHETADNVVQMPSASGILGGLHLSQ